MDVPSRLPDRVSANLPLSGRRGLVIGVANAQSIAWGCARSLSAQGAEVVVSCLNEKAMAVVAPLAAEHGMRAEICDLGADEALDRLVDDVSDRLNGLDFAVHSVAWAPLEDLRGRVIDSSPQGFARAMDISCHSFARLARLCEPRMPRGGSLITMSYLGAGEAVPNYGLMGPVKAALESLVRYVAVELGVRGIRAYAISPGPIPTRAASGLREFDELVRRSAREAPLGRTVTLKEIGALCAFLASEGASGMTGQTLYVDAGRHVIA